MMQLFPGIEDAVDLPPLDGEDWEHLHYVLVLTTGEDIIPLGVGDTISECRNDALATLVKEQVKPEVISRAMKYIGLCNWKEGVAYEPRPGELSRLIIFLCESKVYIYARRYGLSKMLVYFDTNLSEKIVRFANYSDKPLKMRRNLNRRL